MNEALRYLNRIPQVRGGVWDIFVQPHRIKRVYFAAIYQQKISAVINAKKVD